MNIYTRNGDQGMTGLLSNNRIRKDHPYIVFNGHVDELTSQLGMVKVLADDELKSEIERIQNQLIKVMTYAATEFKEKIDLNSEIQFFESKIDDYNALYPEQKSFVTPGDNELSARIDLARAVVRRTERALGPISRSDGVPEDVQRYFNRFSDYLYTMARMIEFRKTVVDLIGNELNIKHEQFNINKSSITMMNLDLAKEISAETEKMANDNKVKVVICVADKAGLPLLVLKMDDAFAVSFKLAMKKAYTSAALKMPTHELAELTKPGGEFYGLADMLDEEIVTLGGGYPIRIGNEIIGAIGVSGGNVKEDTELAQQGALIIERMDI